MSYEYDSLWFLKSLLGIGLFRVPSRLYPQTLSLCLRRPIYERSVVCFGPKPPHSCADVRILSSRVTTYSPLVSVIESQFQALNPSWGHLMRQLGASALSPEP